MSQPDGQSINLYSFCVWHGPGCSGLHDDWCRRGLFHTSEACDADCKAFVNSGEFQVVPRKTNIPGQSTRQLLKRVMDWLCRKT